MFVYAKVRNVLELTEDVSEKCTYTHKHRLFKYKLEINAVCN